MEKVTLFNRYIPKISEVVFDVDFGFNLNMSAVLFKYPLESGFTVTNGVIQNPTRITLNLGMGEQPFNNGIIDHAESFASGIISNFISSGLGNFVAGALSGGFFSGDSRAGMTLTSLQALKIMPEPFDLIIHDLGILKSVLIESINTSQSYEDGSTVFFEVVIEQVQSKNTPRMLEIASIEHDMGEVKVVEVLN